MKRSTATDRFKARYESQMDENPELALLKEDPVKFFGDSYEALTEDLDQNAIRERNLDSKDYVLAQCLENQANAMIDEATTWTGDISSFVTIAMPLVRKIFAKLIAMDLVSIQPIKQPDAKIFYLDFTYTTAPSGGSAADSVADVRDKDYSTRVESKAGAAVKELDLEITDETISAIEKALKAKWTIELEQDLMAYHRLSAETELMKALQDQIIREIDGLVIAALLAGASGTGSGSGSGAGNVTWNPSGWLTGDSRTIDRTAYKKTLYEAVCDASNLIFKKRFRPGTWIIGHPNDIVRLEKLEEFKYTQSPDTTTGSIGRVLEGTLNNRFNVYKDPYWANEGTLLMGYKGSTWTDAVGFFSPYIPLYMTPKIVDPNDFIPRKGLMSRFAYGTLIKDGLATITISSS